MSKRLLIAVLTLGFLLTLGGAAFSSDSPKTDLSPVQKINADAQRYNDLTEVPRHTPAFQKPIEGLQELAQPTSVLPPPYFCSYTDYSGGAAAYYWTIPDPYGDDYFNMRFTQTNPGYLCTLATAYIGTYSDAFVGTPDMDVVVWDDDGFGYPLNELGRVNVPYSALPIGMAYVAVDMRSLNLVFDEDEEFHVGVTTTDQVNNVLAILSDDGSNGQLRSSENWSGFWGLMLDDWGVDVNFLIGVDLCCMDKPYSDCYVQDYNCGPAYYWRQPDAYGDDYFNMRMSVEGPETLAAVDIAIYTGYPEFSPADLDVFVWGSVGGFPDLTDVIYSTTVPFGALVFFPAVNLIPVPGPVIIRDEFHVGWSTDDYTPGGNLACLSDDGSCGTLRSSEWWGVWGTMLGDWGVDVNFLISAHMCKDEFSLCYTEWDYCNMAYFWRLPDVYGDLGDYQKISPQGEGCRLEKVRLALYDNGDPDIYTYNSEVQVWTSDGGGGLPGTKLAGITLTPADYVIYPGMTEVDFTSLNILFDDDIWIGIESFAPTPETGIRTLSDDGTCGNLQSCENWAGYFYYMLDDWGVDVNFILEADFCCVPVDERPCEELGPYGPDEEWVTAGHDFRRTAASDNTTGNAQCAQGLSWMNYDIAGFIYGRPMIYDGRVFAPYNDKLQVFDLNGGALLHTFTGLPEMGSNFRNSVTCKDGHVYYGGGNGRSFTKAELAGYTTVWTRGVLNLPFTGNTQYTTSVILDCGGTEVVFLTTDAGELYALDAATGLNYGGWVPNPLMLDGDPGHTLSSNGADVLYVGTTGSYGSAGNGTMYAIDACTGAIIWTLGYGDLEGPALSGLADPGEIFQGPLAVDLNGQIFAITGFDLSAGPPSGGVYCISPGGSIVWAKGGQFPRFTGPVIDAANVLVQYLRFWSSEPETMKAYKKSSGSIAWESDPAYDGLSWVEGALSCEFGAPDLLYTGNTDGQFLVVNADDGTVEFEYNYVVGLSGRGSGAAIDNTHVVMNNRQGELYVFTELVDRPRLRIMKFDELAAVPFFSPDGYLVTYEDVFMNNGCANLTGTLTPDENPAAFMSQVNPERIARMQDAANSMLDYSFADMAGDLVKSQRVDGSSFDADFIESPYAKDSYSNMAAYGPPGWLNGIQVSAFNLAAGASFNVVYDVNGPLVSRGPQRCYVTITSNDQYYLNSADNPVVQLGVIGGCLEADDVLHFGAANVAPVMSTGEIGNQNVTLWEIDGDDAPYWQGGLFFAADQHRLAWTTESWHAADPDDFWNSLLPDPNCFDQCEPYVSPDPVILCRMSNDGGMTYDDVYGYASVGAYVDSVVDFDCYGTGWSWDNNACSFDNALTMGFRVEEYMYGAVDVPALANVVVYRLDVTNRNPDPIDVYMGAFHDFDLEANGFDLFDFDAANQIMWGASCANVDVTDTKVWGNGQVACDVPMIGVRTLDANQAMWHADYVALDSMYYWMTDPGEAGRTWQAGIDPNFPCDPASESDDRDAWVGFRGLNLGGNETISTGFYQFGMVGDVTDAAAYADLAKLVKEYCGFNRGDMNQNGGIDLGDVVALYNIIYAGGPGPLFEHSMDVDGSGTVDGADILYLSNFHFCLGPAPVCGWALVNICP